MCGATPQQIQKFKETKPSLGSSGQKQKQKKKKKKKRDKRANGTRLNNKVQN